MNRKIMKMASVVLALLLVAGVAGSAFAAVTDVNFTTMGSDKLFVFTPQNTDLFANFKNLMPGDTVEQTITVQNTSGHLVRLWLMTKPEVAEADRDFLSQLKLTVTSGKKDLFEAAASEQGQLIPTKESPYGVLLGTFNQKGTVELTATIQVPVTLDNAYMGREGKVPWTFTAEEVILPDTPSTGDDFTLWVWVAVGGVLLAGIVVLVIRQRKQEN